MAQISKTGNGLSLLLYKNARSDMDILDETFGPMNWMRRHARDNANCIVSVWDDDKRQWIEKEDTGTESNTEAEKGLASDSFKRACVNVGIGRELYTAPFIWIAPPNCEIKGEAGKYKCFDRFEVEEIGYNDRREINYLRIINAKTKNVVFEFDERGKAEPKKPSTPKTAVECERCGKQLARNNHFEGEWGAWEAHHRVAVKSGGSDAPSNGEALCLDCHKKTRTYGG